MNKTHLSLAIALACSSAFVAAPAVAAEPALSFSKVWTFSHTGGGFQSEIVSFDSLNGNLWVTGGSGVDVINVTSGLRVGSRIDTTSFGSINSVAIHGGLAAFAIESKTKTDPGTVKLYDTTSRALASGTNSITVGALPDMLTFTKDGTKLLVANEATPSTYGALTSTPGAFPRTYGAAAVDPVGSVSIIDMGSRTVTATANPNLLTVTRTGSNIRTNTGMDFEPEYIAVNAAGTKAIVTLQEANAVGVLNLATNAFDKVIGLGVKDFSAAGNQIDPLNNDTVSFQSVAAKGLYMPDGVSVFETGGATYMVLANEGDFREDDDDRSAASSVSSLNVSPLNKLRVSNTDSSGTSLYAAGARSFSIRDENGVLVYDSGNILEKEANDRGVYDDSRSRDKGVEPEGIEIMTIGDRTFALVGLERTLKAAVGIFDITDPANSTFVDMLVSDGDRAPEGLEGFTMDGNYYLAFSNENSNTTSLYQLTAPIPEPETYALMLAGLGLVAAMARRRKK
jgi:DNA-binding beta-propeller fold protein YncE